MTSGGSNGARAGGLPAVAHRHAEIRDLAFGLRNNLEIEGYTVDLAADGPSGLEAVRSQPPDLVGLDLMLPGMDGYCVLRHLRGDGRTMPVLILTAKGEETRRVGDVEVEPATRTVRRGGEAVPLTPMEFDLLPALLDRNGAIVSRLELLKDVRGHSSAVLTRTVDTHIGELRRKLEPDPSAPRHILTVRKAAIGWRSSGSGAPHLPQLGGPGSGPGRDKSFRRIDNPCALP